MNNEISRQTLRRNIELKARLEDLESARKTADRLATQRSPDQHQRDTYFVCRHGRLKLREIRGQAAQLISYARDDLASTKASHYRLLEVSEPELIGEMLLTTLGLLVVVEKHREITFHNHVRIHLDDVRDLGTFIEFEAVLGPDDPESAGHEIVQSLCREFAVRDEQVLADSYSDMVLQRRGAEGQS
jgi:predicted adenylyl cyclase CyaB